MTRANYAFWKIGVIVATPEVELRMVDCGNEEKRDIIAHYPFCEVSLFMRRPGDENGEWR